jgi:hypothetical protein
MTPDQFTNQELFLDVGEGHSLYVQGRYDIVWPPIFAYELSQALPNSRLTWSINGHLGEHESVSLQRLLLNQLTGAA